MASFVPKPVFKFRCSHYAVLAAGFFLWALVLIGVWYFMIIPS